MKTYIFSIALNWDPIAETSDIALDQAEEMIKQGDYTIDLVEVTDEEENDYLIIKKDK